MFEDFNSYSFVIVWCTYNFFECVCVGLLRKKI